MFFLKKKKRKKERKRRTPSNIIRRKPCRSKTVESVPRSKPEPNGPFGKSDLLTGRHHIYICQLINLDHNRHLIIEPPPDTGVYSRLAGLWASLLSTRLNDGPTNAMWHQMLR